MQEIKGIVHPKNQEKLLTEGRKLFLGKNNPKLAKKEEIKTRYQIIKWLMEKEGDVGNVNGDHHRNRRL